MFALPFRPQDTAPDVYETEDAAPDTNRRGEVRPASVALFELAAADAPDAASFLPRLRQLDDSDDELLNAAGSAARRVDTASGPNEGIDETGLPSFDSAGRKFGALAARELEPSLPRAFPFLAPALTMHPALPPLQ